MEVRRKTEVDIIRFPARVRDGMTVVPELGYRHALVHGARSNGAMLWLRESGRPHRIARSRPSGGDDEVGQIADSRYWVVTMR